MISGCFPELTMEIWGGPGGGVPGPPNGSELTPFGGAEYPPKSAILLIQHLLSGFGKPLSHHT